MSSKFLLAIFATLSIAGVVVASDDVLRDKNHKSPEYKPAGGPSNPAFTNLIGNDVVRSIQMEGVAGFVAGRAREALRLAISKEGTNWLCDAFAEVVERRRRGETPSFSLRELFRQDEELKFAVKEELKRRIKAWLPGQVRGLLVQDLLGGVVGGERIEEIEALVAQVASELDTTLNGHIDAVAGSWYDSAVENLKKEAQRMGAPDWLDITDVKGSVRRAFDVGTIVNTAADRLSPLIGDAVVTGIRRRITDALGGQLPPEVIAALQRGPDEFDKYVRMAQNYIPGNALRQLQGSILNRPVIKLPTPTYAYILAASAAGHFTKAFSGVFVDPYELKRGIEVTRVMVWQIRNREFVNLSIMQLASLSRGIAESFGAGAVVDGLASKVGAPLGRIQRLADQIDAKLMKPIEMVRGELRSLADQMRRELLALQEVLVAPVREALDTIQDGLNQAGGEIIGALPDGFNGLPKDWETLKEKLGLPGGILGEAGDISAKDVLSNIAEETGLNEVAVKVRADLDELNDAVAEKISTGAVAVLEAVHLLGPTAEILGVERTPPRNESKSNELDPVLLHNGEFVASVTDLVIPGRGIDFRFTRIYRGRSKFLGEFGHGWTHSYAERLLPWNDGRCEGLTYINEEGRKSFFCRKGDSYISPAGVYLTLIRKTDGYELSARTGGAKFFDALGRIVEIRDRHGNSVRFRYDPRDLLSEIIDVFGREIKIGGREDGLISRLTDFAGRTFRYEYNDDKELIGVTTPSTPDFPKGKTTAYRYVRSPKGAHSLEMIMDPAGAVYLKNRYDNLGRVVAQMYGGGSVTDTSGAVASGRWMTVGYADAGDGDDVATRAWVVDRTGTTYLYEHDTAGHLLRRWRWDGRFYHLTKSHSYNEDGEVTSTCLPSGRCWFMSYGDAAFRGMATEIKERPSRGGGARVTGFEYEPGLGRIASTSNPLGVVTRFDTSTRPKPRPEGRGLERGSVSTLRASTELSRVSIPRPSGRGVERVDYTQGDEGEQIEVSRRGVGGQGWEFVSRQVYNGSGQLVKSTDGRGMVTRYDYFPAHDPDGDGVMVPAAASIASGGGYLRSITRGAVTEFSYDPVGNVTKVINPDGVDLSFVVNALNQVIREEKVGETPVNYHFDANDNLQRVVIETAVGRVINEYEYGPLDMLVKERRQISEGHFAETGYFYDGAQRLVSVRYPEGNTDAFEYDSEGRPSCVVRGAGSNEASRECVERDVDGGVVVLVDGNGDRTRYERDGFGEIAAVTDATGGRREFDRDSIGRVVAIRTLDAGSKLLAEARLKYDAAGNVVERADRLWREDPSQSRWVKYKWEYDPAGNLIAATNALGGVTRFERDGLDNVVAAIDPTGVKKTYIYDVMGRLVESYTVSAGKKIDVTKISYDEAGRPIVIDREDGATWRYRYDTMGNLTSITDPYGTETRFETDDLGRCTEVVAVSGDSEIATHNEWDGNGRLTKITDATGNVTEFDYDTRDRLILEKYANGSTRQIFYDGRDNVVRVADRNGDTITIERDPVGRMLSRQAKSLSGRGDVDQRFKYDAMGRLIFATDGTGEDLGEVVSQFVYDSLSRPIAERAGGRWITRQYDDGSNVSVIGLHSGAAMYYFYDASGRPTAILGGDRRLTSFEHNSAGNLAKATLAGDFIMENNYSQQGHLILRNYSVRNSVVLGRMEYNYDHGGHLWSEQGSKGEIKRIYERDPLGRLVGVKDIARDDVSETTIRDWRYELDAVGNWVSRRDRDDSESFETDSINAYASITGDGANIWLRYDAAGNLMAYGNREFEYDALGRLISIRDGDRETARYRYDVFDRRTVKFAAGKKGEFIWDGWRLVEKYEDGDALMTYVYSTGVSTPFAAIGPEGGGRKPYYLLSDIRGTVRGVYDYSSDVVTHCNYEPYGEVISEDCNMEDIPFGFAGHISDKESGLVYMRERYYDPKIGRFITPDPIGYKVSLRAKSRVTSPMLMSYHAGQGGASHATFPNRSLVIHDAYGVHPFGRVFRPAHRDAQPGEMNLYLYARGDPSRFVDVLGLASLLFDKSDGRMNLYEDGGDFMTDPLGGRGNSPFPKGAFAVGVPEFMNEDYRQDIYEHSGFGELEPREGVVTDLGWTGKKTLGCIRADDLELETLVADMVRFRRHGDPVTSITVRITNKSQTGKESLPISQAGFYKSHHSPITGVKQDEQLFVTGKFPHINPLRRGPVYDLRAETRHWGAAN